MLIVLLPPIITFSSPSVLQLRKGVPDTSTRGASLGRLTSFRAATTEGLSTTLMLSNAKVKWELNRQYCPEMLHLL